MTTDLRRRVVRGIGAIALLAHLGCVTTHVGEITTTVAADTASAATLSIAGQDYPMTVCRSGDREYFLGVDLSDRDGRARIRLVVDAIEGPRLKIVLAGEGSQDVISLASKSCRRLEAQIHPTGWRVNRVRDFSGSLEADCTSSAGVEIVAHLRFQHCH